MSTQLIMASRLLKELGINHKAGSVDVLKQLNILGIKPADQKIWAKGIQWFISYDDYKKIIDQRLEVQEKPQEEHRKHDLNFQTRHQYRTLARAILHLYESLGEEPNNLSNLKKLAGKS